MLKQYDNSYTDISGNDLNIGNSPRRHYLDNIRTISILSLFVLHTCEIYHCKEVFHIEGRDSLVPTLIYNFASSWLMLCLFFIAGTTSMYSLKKRTIKEFYVDRAKRILKPFCFGIFFWIPIQSYWTLKYNVGFEGSFIDGYKYFFTHFDSGFYGYSGEFTPAHLWFLLFLFVYTVLAYPFIRLKLKKMSLLQNKRVISIPLIIFYALVTEMLSFGSSDETFVRFFVFFVLGVLLYNNNQIFEFSKRNWFILSAFAFVLNSITSVLCVLMKDMNIFTIEYIVSRYIWAMSSIVACLAFIGVGQRLFNKQGRVLSYLSKHSYGIYFIHMPVLVTVAYFIMQNMNLNIVVEMLLIFVGSIIATFGVLAIFRRIPLVRWMFEIR